MAQPTLESLLVRIRDGATDPELLAMARAFVGSEVRLPEELREVVDFDEDPVGDAVGLLAVLGVDSLFGDAFFGEIMREGMASELIEAPIVLLEQVDGPWELHDAFVAAIHEEAGGCECASAVLAALDVSEVQPPIALAVQRSAGPIELVDAVLAALGVQSFTVPFADAIAGEAGSIDVLEAVESALTDLRLPLAAAIRDEAGEVELVASVLQALGVEAALPVAAAVHDEAGEIGVWSEIEPVIADSWVSAMLDGELSASAKRAAIQRLHNESGAHETMAGFASLGTDLRGAVAEGAGPCPELWSAIAGAIGVDAEAVPGWEQVPFAAAVRDEAGPVDVTQAVLAEIRQATRMPVSAVEVGTLPVPANGRFNLSAVLMMAAAALLLLGLPQILSGQGTIQPGDNTVFVSSDDQFASASEIIVEELDYGDNSNVYQATGDEGALILWVDEGKTL